MNLNFSHLSTLSARAVDDVSGKRRALIRVSGSNGTLLGKIEKVFPAPNEDPNPKCDKCEGANKHAPIAGQP